MEIITNIYSHHYIILTIYLASFILRFFDLSKMLDPKDRRKRIRKLEKEIERFKQKYGMDFEEFFELTEHGFGKLLKMGFDPDEILRDVSEWEDLEEELRELKGEE